MRDNNGSNNSNDKSSSNNTNSSPIYDGQHSAYDSHRGHTSTPAPFAVGPGPNSGRGSLDYAHHSN